MKVYRKLPSGLAAADLRRAAQTDRARFRWTVARFVAGLLLIVVILWDTTPSAVVGLAAFSAIALLLSCLRFARYSARLAIEIPSVSLESVNKWTGKQRSTWLVRCDGVNDAVAEIALALRNDLGEPVVAIIEPDGSENETVLDLALAQRDRSFMAVWSEGSSRGTVAIKPTMTGLWLRVDPQPDGGVGAVLVSDVGDFENRMRMAISGA